MAHCTHNEYMASLIKEFANFEDHVPIQSHDLSKIPPWGEIKGGLSELPEKIDDVTAKHPEAGLSIDHCDILKQDYNAMLSRYPNHLKIELEGKDAPFVHGPGLTIEDKPAALVLAPSGAKQLSAHGMTYSARFKRLETKNGGLAFLGKTTELRAADISAPWGQPKEFEATGARGAFKKDLGGKHVVGDGYRLFMVKVFCHLAKYKSLEAASADFEPTISTSTETLTRPDDAKRPFRDDENMGTGKLNGEVIGKATADEASPTGKQHKKLTLTDTLESSASSTASQTTAFSSPILDKSQTPDYDESDGESLGSKSSEPHSTDTPQTSRKFQAYFEDAMEE